LRRTPVSISDCLGSEWPERWDKESKNFEKKNRRNLQKLVTVVYYDPSVNVVVTAAAGSSQVPAQWILRRRSGGLEIQVEPQRWKVRFGCFCLLGFAMGED